MLEDYFEEEEEEDDEQQQQQQQQPTSAEVAINKGQRNQPNCSAVSVLLAAKERARPARCDGLCMVPCFAEYHAKVNL
jgi:FtsZ-interacting cell division protein YlmF